MISCLHDVMKACLQNYFGVRVAETGKEAAMTVNFVLVGGEKGGPGKTMIACELAVMAAIQGRKVLLVDGDPQRSAAKFMERRKDDFIRDAGNDVPLPEVLEIRAGDIRSVVPREMREHDFDFVVMDVPGRDSEELRSAVGAAEVVIFPLRPNIADLETAEEFDRLVGRVRAEPKTLMREALFVLNQASTNPHRRSNVEGAKRSLEQFENISVAATVVHLRAAFEDASLLGASVFEMGSGAAKAQDEIGDLYAEILSVGENEQRRAG